MFDRRDDAFRVARASLMPGFSAAEVDLQFVPVLADRFTGSEAEGRMQGRL